MSLSVAQSQKKVSAKSGTRALFALAISAFGIGTTEFVPVGLLASIADDLNIAITLGNLLISGYAIAVAIGAPILHDVTGISPGKINIILIVYGVAVAFGNSLGGKLANKNPIRALFWMFIIQAIVLVLLTFLAPFKVAGIIGVLLMGLFAFMNVPGLQQYVVQLAEKYVPSAVDVASANNIAAFNVGIAVGSIIGGVVIDT